MYCTGYKVTFPFFDEGFISAPDNDLPLFRRVFHPDIAERVLHRAAAAARRDHAARRGAGGRGSRDYLARRYALPAPADAARRHRARAARDVQALRGLQAPHDAGRLRRLPGRAAPRSARRARSGRDAPGSALPVAAAGRAGRARAAARPLAGRRERRRPPTAPRSSTRAARSSPSSATARPACATSCAAPTSPRARSTTTSPTRSPSSARSCDEVGAEARRRVRAARRRRATPRDVRRGRLPRLLRLHRRGRRARRLPVAQRGRDPRACSRSRRRPRASASWRTTCARRSPRASAGARRRATARRRWSRSALELGQRLVERDPPDVDGATRFATPTCSWPLSCRALVQPAPPPRPPLHVGIGENTPGPVLATRCSPRSGSSRSPRRLLRRDDERRRRARSASPTTSLAARAAGIEPLVTFEHARGAPRSARSGRTGASAQCRLPSAARVPARRSGVPQALPVRALIRAVERDQPLHAADLREPEGGGELHPDRAQELLRLQGRRRRPARPGRPPARQEADVPSHAALHQALPASALQGRRARSAGCTTTRTSTASATPARRRSSRRSAASRSG